MEAARAIRSAVKARKRLALSTRRQVPMPGWP